MTDVNQVPPGGKTLGRIFVERQYLLALVLLVLLTIPMLTKIFTSDYGTHLALGRHTIETMSVSDKEFLNYPSFGRTNPNGEWGFQAVLWLVHSVGGNYGVSLFVWSVVVGIYLLIHRSAVLRGANPLIAVAAIAAFSGFLRIRIQPRPEIFTYFFIALTIFIYSEFYFGKRKNLVWGIPALVLIWANCHPTYLMFFVLSAAFVGERFVHALIDSEMSGTYFKEKILPPAAMVAVGLVVCGFNPHGWNQILLPLALIFQSKASGGGSAMLSSISELTPTHQTGMFVYYKAAAWLAGISAVLGLMGRRLTLLDLGLFAIAFKASWDSARAVSMMGLFLSGGISLQLTGFLDKVGEWFAPSIQKAPKQEQKGRAVKGGVVKQAPAPVSVPKTSGSWNGGRIIVAGLLVVCLLGMGVTTMSYSMSQLEWGVGVTEHKFSFKAAEFLRANPIKGPMFNFFDIGGFLDWQVFPNGMPTFIDGRTYNQEVFLEHQNVTSGMPGWQSVFAKYGFTYAVLKSMDSSGMVLPTVQALSQDPEWALVFADGLFVVFAKRNVDNKALIAKFEQPNGALPRHVIQEAYHYTFLGIHPFMAARTIHGMARYLGSINDREGMMYGLETMLSLYEKNGDREMQIWAIQQIVPYKNDPALRAKLTRLQGGGSR